MSKLNAPEKIGFGVFLLLAILTAGLPVFLGFFTPLWLPQFGSLLDGVLPWTPLLVVLYMIIIVVLAEISDRIVLRVFNSASRVSVEVLQSLLTFIVMVGCYRLTMTEYRAAVVAALIASIGYLVLSPVINHLYKTAPRD